MPQSPAWFEHWREEINRVRSEEDYCPQPRIPLEVFLQLPGALLSRKWKGRSIPVEVLAKGFRHENRQYSSLSAIAVAVTGTRWNGLAFFGPTGGNAKRKERARAQK